MMTEDKEEITPVGKRQYKRGKERRQDWLFLFIGTALLKHWDGGFLKIGTEA